jgi:hypothetical protein
MGINRATGEASGLWNGGYLSMWKIFCCSLEFLNTAASHTRYNIRLYSYNSGYCTQIWLVGFLLMANHRIHKFTSFIF